MTEYINVIDGQPILTAKSTSYIIDTFKNKTRTAEKLDELKKALVEEMANKNIYHLQNDKISIAFVPASSREVFDVSGFRASSPDVYDQYVRLAHIKPQVRVTLRGE